VRLRGDLIVNTVTDEETSGAGGLAAVSHGIEADAGIVTEPTAFDVWVGMPRSLSPDDHGRGPPGHAEMAQPHWRDGGAVNAIEKMSVVLGCDPPTARGVARAPGQAPRHLSPSDIVPAIIAAASGWSPTVQLHPQSELMYLPANADADGWGTLVEREVTEWIQRAAPPTPGWPSTRR
jgi:acetylornithine deacetylase